MQLAEIKNGRLAMMAITGMAVQEFVWGTPVIDQVPFLTLLSCLLTFPYFLLLARVHARC